LGRTSDGEWFGCAHCLAHGRQSDRRRYPTLCPDRGPPDGYSPWDALIAPKIRR
jgi:hypothetical protein